MTTSEKPTDEKIQHLTDMIAKVRDMAETDTHAEMTISILEYIGLLQVQLHSLRDIVLEQNNVLKLLMEVVEAGTITMPEAPDNLPGYM